MPMSLGNPIASLEDMTATLMKNQCINDRQVFIRYSNSSSPGLGYAPYNPKEQLMIKNTIVTIFSFMLLTNAAHAWEPDNNDKLELSVAQAILKAKEKDPNISTWFESAYAYAVFPRVGKAGIGVGGAHGKGIVIRDDQTVGTTSLSQVTIGFQLGGQVYSEFIMFKDEVAFQHFTRGNFELGAQASAVAINLGASADADYDKGVAVFTIAEGGLMYEASIGGQKFKYKPAKN
jgi:lipid-binding SYLF domain-containing protein